MVNCGVMKVHWNLAMLQFPMLLKNNVENHGNQKEKDVLYKQIEIFDFE